MCIYIFINECFRIKRVSKIKILLLIEVLIVSTRWFCILPYTLREINYDK